MAFKHLHRASAARRRRPGLSARTWTRGDGGETRTGEGGRTCGTAQTCLGPRVLHASGRAALKETGLCAPCPSERVHQVSESTGGGTGAWTLPPGATHHPAGPQTTVAQFEPGWL